MHTGRLSRPPLPSNASRNWTTLVAAVYGTNLFVCTQLLSFSLSFIGSVLMHILLSRPAPTINAWESSTTCWCRCTGQWIVHGMVFLSFFLFSPGPASPINQRFNVLNHLIGAGNPGQRGKRIKETWFPPIITSLTNNWWVTLFLLFLFLDAESTLTLLSAGAGQYNVYIIISLW